MRVSCLTHAWKCGIVSVAMGSLLAVSTSAQNLLEKATVWVTTNRAAGPEGWVPEITFGKQGTYALMLRTEFTVQALPRTPVLTLKKNPHISEWTLNGQALLGPPKDMFFPEWEGLPVSALKVGKNVLEASFKVNVREDKGKLSPSSSGEITLALNPGDVKQFEIRTGPVLGAAGYDYFTVGCRTRMPAIVTLHCDGRTWASKPGVIHRLRADGLKEGKGYEYKLVASLVGGGATASSKTWKVKTLSSKGPWTFVAFGDARNNPKIWGRITAEAMKFKPDFVMHTGDIIGNGNDYEAWDREFSKPSEEFLATVPCFYTFGNHENNVSMIYELFGFPQDERSSYTQLIGPVQLFAMNRFENWGKGSANLVRMEKELAASKAPFIFAFTHPPAWSSGSHGNDSLGKEVHFPIFDTYGVTALIAGHDHCYERSEPGGTSMLIAGGAGASLYKPEHAKDNPHSKVYRSEYGFLVFQTDGAKCGMAAYVYGGLDTPDEQRKLEEVDRREWAPRQRFGKPPGGKQR
ncbi:MAG: metallophosphoesterase [bacterium]